MAGAAVFKQITQPVDTKKTREKSIHVLRVQPGTTWKSQVSGEPPRKQEGKGRQEGEREREAGGGRAWGLVLKWQEAPGPGAQWDSYLLSGD